MWGSALRFLVGKLRFPIRKRSDAAKRNLGLRARQIIERRTKYVRPNR